MKRAQAHALFGTLTLVCMGLVAQPAFNLFRANQLNRAMAGATKIDSTMSRESLPVEAQLVHANTLAAAGKADAAINLFNRLIQAGVPSHVRHTALFNVANLYLRQGMQSTSGDSLASVELAKQRYRDLLRLAPNDWDARYNLERALRLAPEEESAFSNDPAIAEQRRIKLRTFEAVDLP